MVRNWVAALAAVGGIAVGALAGPHVLAASNDAGAEGSLADRIAIEDMVTRYYGNFGKQDAAEDFGAFYTEDAVFDVNGIVSTWSPDFPGFKVTGQSVTQFQSGPALMFEAESDNSPLGVPLKIVHAEAIDSGRFYALECLVERGAADEARPMIDFIIANFSTRSDGTCCIDPADPRG